jgi:hypothetical protein
MPATTPAPDPAYPQSADAVLMVRPARFGWNPETGSSNHFQAPAPPAGDDAGRRAVAEFDALARVLAQSGVEVHALDDRADLGCPDAVFPNNWVSLHPDGTVVLYPMLAPNRRRERRLELLRELEERGGFVVTRLLDLTHHERHGRFLEGTGSVVFDHLARRAYAGLSPRTDAAVFEELCAELGYAGIAFHAADRDGVPVYHTNVALAVGTRFAVVCAAAVPEHERAALLAGLADGGRHVEVIGPAQMMNFAGNLLELRAHTGERVLALSHRALESLPADARSRLAACVDGVVTVPVPTIETLGGGSVRCMLAEVFLPRAPGRSAPSRSGRIP